MEFHFILQKQAQNILQWVTFKENLYMYVLEIQLGSA